MYRIPRGNLSDELKKAIARCSVKVKPALAQGAEASTGTKWAVAEAKAKWTP